MMYTSRVLCLLAGLGISACVSVRVVTVDVDTSHLAAYTSDYFLSVTIDADVIGAHLYPVQNFTPPRLLNMARELSPAVWRFGGTGEDYTIFTPSANAVQDSDTSVLNEKQWDMINGFSRAGWHLIYGLSALRMASGIQAMQKNFSTTRHVKDTRSAGNWETVLLHNLEAE